MYFISLPSKLFWIYLDLTSVLRFMIVLMFYAMLGSVFIELTSNGLDIANCLLPMIYHPLSKLQQSWFMLSGWDQWISLFCWNIYKLDGRNSKLPELPSTARDEESRTWSYKISWTRIELLFIQNQKRSQKFHRRRIHEKKLFHENTI